MITTREFAIAPSATAAHLARQWLWRRWPLFVLPVAALLVASTADVRFALVALMVVFVVWPMALAFVWFGRALAPDAVRASCPHCLEFSASGLRIIYGEREGYPTPPAESVEAADVKAVDDRGKTIAIVLAGGRSIIVPADVLDADDWRRVKSLYRGRPA